MELNQVLSKLQYLESPNYLQGKALESDRDSGHIFRKALEECGLKGVYVLNGAAFDKSRGNVPVVYVCQADTEAQAREIHRKVWNQNVVPFVLVVSRGWIRLYRGFQYNRDEQDAFRLVYNRKCLNRNERKIIYVKKRELARFNLLAMKY